LVFKTSSSGLDQLAPPGTFVEKNTTNFVSNLKGFLSPVGSGIFLHQEIIGGKLAVAGAETRCFFMIKPLIHVL